MTRRDAMRPAATNGALLDFVCATSGRTSQTWQRTQKTPSEQGPIDLSFVHTQRSLRRVSAQQVTPPFVRRPDAFGRTDESNPTNRRCQWVGGANADDSSVNRRLCCLRSALHPGVPSHPQGRLFRPAERLEKAPTLTLLLYPHVAAARLAGP